MDGITLIRVFWVSILIIGFIELALRPRLDRTRKGDLLLWYGSGRRKYLKIK